MIPPRPLGDRAPVTDLVGGTSQQRSCSAAAAQAACAAQLLARAAQMARQASLLLRLLNLPSFLLAVFIMYWSVPLCMLQNRIRPWRLRGPRNDAYGWCACTRNAPRWPALVPWPAQLRSVVSTACVGAKGIGLTTIVRYHDAASAGSDAVQRRTLHLAGMLLATCSRGCALCRQAVPRII